jgi:hypothetical protein
MQLDHEARQHFLLRISNHALAHVRTPAGSAHYEVKGASKLNGIVPAEAGTTNPALASHPT